jgi:hypothetical protein
MLVLLGQTWNSTSRLPDLFHGQAFPQNPRMDTLIFLLDSQFDNLTYIFQRNQEGFLQTLSTPQIYILNAILGSHKSEAKGPKIIFHWQSKIFRQSLQFE